MSKQKSTDANDLGVDNQSKLDCVLISRKQVRRDLEKMLQCCVTSEVELVGIFREV